MEFAFMVWFLFAENVADDEVKNYKKPIEDKQKNSQTTFVKIQYLKRLFKF